MKKSEITVGTKYAAKVNDVVTNVIVNKIRKDSQGSTVYDVTNLRTGRKTTFRSAAKFRYEVKGIDTTMPTIGDSGKGKKPSKKLDLNSPLPTVETPHTTLSERLKAQVQAHVAPHAVVLAYAGCLAADTIINVNRGGGGRQMRIDQLVSQFNGDRFTITRKYTDKRTGKEVVSTQTCAKAWDLSIPTYVARAVNGVVRLGKLRNAWFSGVKKTFTVTTDMGRQIRGTAIHPFLMADGSWKQLAQLLPGDQVQVNSGRSSNGSSGSKTAYPNVNVKYHPNQTHNGKGVYVVPKHRAVVEADMNGISYEEFIQILRKDADKASDLKYLDRKSIVHHKNENVYDWSLDNLEVCRSQQEHATQHNWGDNVLEQIGIEEIVDVEFFGEEPTFDLEVDDEPHNFLANGFVVHNTGKTFTQVMGVAWAFGYDRDTGVHLWDEIQYLLSQHAGKPSWDFKVTPSEEQQVIWDELVRSRGIKTVTYCAFNKSIVNEFSSKWGWLVKFLSERCGVTLTFSTINSMGYRAVSQVYGRINSEDTRTADLISVELRRDIRELRRFQPVLVSAVESLVEYSKLTLAGWNEKEGFSPSKVTDDVLDELASHYDVETNGERSRAYDLVRKILERSLDRSYVIDYNDQNWLPVVLNFAVTKSDLLLVDEGQDLSRCKQQFAMMSGKRIVIVGDSYQAIYGFAGADVDSLPRMQKLLGDVKPLRLTETRRCGKAIVKEAQKYVPDFKAHESNPEGLVRRSTMNKWAADAQDGDMVLARVNAPLVSQALKFIKAGRKAAIRGRDFGKSLVSFVKRLEASSVSDLLDKANDWKEKECQKEAAKKHPSEQRIQALEDRVACIESFCDGAATVNDVTDKIWVVFAGKLCPQCTKSFNEAVDECYNCKQKLVNPKGVMFSSVHKAKGLESDRVFILLPKGAEMPHPMAKTAWQKGQEINLLYVAVTRAINELVFVDEPSI